MGSPFTGEMPKPEEGGCLPEEPGPSVWCQMPSSGIWGSLPGAKVGKQEVRRQACLRPGLCETCAARAPGASQGWGEEEGYSHRGAQAGASGGHPAPASLQGLAVWEVQRAVGNGQIGLQGRLKELNWAWGWGRCWRRELRRAGSWKAWKGSLSAEWGQGPHSR